MADLALERRMLIDDLRKNAQGDKIFKVLPWESVVYSTGASKIGGLEPVNFTASAISKDNGTDREIRSIEFIDEGKLFSLTQTGGQVGLPTG